MRNSIVLTSIALCAIQTISGCQERVRPVENQHGTTAMTPSPEPIGTARMLADRSIVLNLRAETEGAAGHAQLSYPVGDPMYAKILEHVGGLTPGQEKSVPPFPEQ
ncbi:hypothetical protein INH39_08070 [Massilia violaceinigra]|uniref:Uncharacterized protein n=1 Tax=Massilia violaceinigra TaxID=2045208 RepID=A0ABY4AGB4_9BURK|nr:hypothetical protein [Massilia violaceinigra]UOD31628.1 hypothetical protein INH39_08070 [Massilia violaceinigra]